MNYSDLVLEKNIIISERKKIYLYIKRFADVFLSLIALITFLPVFLVISLLIKIDSEGPSIYKHKRIGKGGKEFYLYKFRTMVINSDEIFRNFTEEQKHEYEKFFKLENDPRITKIGKFLRKSSLDELPQLINIILGDMSIIGPRPLVEREIERYGENKQKYLSYLPGLTSWWACNGRNDISYEERMELELYYVNNFSFKLDVLCFFKTIIAVIKHKGAK